MLIHLTPRIYACRTNQPCTLIDLTCAELGLSLKGDKDLTARRPYRNKNYLVACRKVGQKAMQGILIDSRQFVYDFTVVTRWAVGNRDIATHRVRYIVLDHEYDTVTENMMLWSAIHGDSRWASRFPAEYKGVAHTEAQPFMDVTQGFESECSETFLMHTIERERLHEHYCSLNERTPGIEAAFPAKGPSNANPKSKVVYFRPDEAVDCPFTTEVEILLGGVARGIYPDGTEQFLDEDYEPWLFYSPRLSREKLEQFCEENIAHYQEFNQANMQQLIRCERVPMKPFWES